jgi:hypothetical protein
MGEDGKADDHLDNVLPEDKKCPDSEKQCDGY